jgi:hypothetical protein
LEKFVLKYVKDLNLKGFEIWFEKGFEKKKRKRKKQNKPNPTYPRGPLSSPSPFLSTAAQLPISGPAGRSTSAPAFSLFRRLKGGAHLSGPSSSSGKPPAAASDRPAPPPLLHRAIKHHPTHPPPPTRTPRPFPSP